MIFPSMSGVLGPAAPTRYLTPEHPDLVPQHQDLRVLRYVAPRQDRQPAEQPDHKQIHEAKEHERRQ